MFGVLLYAKIYEMIFTAPDQVLKFIGFGLMNLGEESSTGRISGAFNKASDVGSKMASRANTRQATGKVDAKNARGSGGGTGGGRVE